MFFVFQSSSRTVHEYKDLNSLLQGYESSHTAEDLFWTLGLKSWISIAEAITDNVQKKRKFQIPALPATIPTQPPLQHSVVSEPEQTITAIPLEDQDEDFKIIPYDPPKPQAPAQTEKVATQNINKRKYPRFDIRLKVIISNKEKTFLSYTSNVSIGGVALEDNIPKEYFNQNADTEIFISSPKKNEFLAFRCQPVGDDEDPKRFSFGEISEQSLAKFQDWINKLKT